MLSYAPLIKAFIDAISVNLSADKPIDGSSSKKSSHDVNVKNKTDRRSKILFVLNV